MNIFIVGSGVFGVMVAEKLVGADHVVLGVASPKFKRNSSKGDDLDRLRNWAKESGVSWVDDAKLKSKFIPDGVDVIIAAHSHAYVGKAVRQRAKIASIGYHPSLLPLHRGIDAIRWTIRDGDKVSGGTVYHLTEVTDGGAIAAQEHVLVPPGATPQSLWRDCLAPLGIKLILQVVDDLACGRSVKIVQDETLATWEPAMKYPPSIETMMSMKKS